jgi:hypothetical protein
MEQSIKHEVVCPLSRRVLAAARVLIAEDDALITIGYGRGRAHRRC